VPQLKPNDWHVAGVQLETQMMLLHVWPAGQVPQLRMPPQPSPVWPQFAPTWAQVLGVHGALHWL